RRRLRLRARSEHLDARLVGHDPAARRRARLLARRPAGGHRRTAPPPGRDRRDGAARRLREAAARDRLGAERLVGGGPPADDPLVCRAPRSLAGPRRLADAGADAPAMRVLATGGAGFLGSHLVELLEARGDDVFVPRRRDYDLTRYDETERLFSDARPELVFHL